jgi:hypothetical protein
MKFRRERGNPGQPEIGAVTGLPLARRKRKRRHEAGVAVWGDW